MHFGLTFHCDWVESRAPPLNYHWPLMAQFLSRLKAQAGLEPGAAILEGVSSTWSWDLCGLLARSQQDTSISLNYAAVGVLDSLSSLLLGSVPSTSA